MPVAGVLGVVDWATGSAAAAGSFPLAVEPPALEPPALEPPALGPVALGPVALGPVALGPVALGPVSVGGAARVVMPPEVVDFDSGSDFDSDFWAVELEADGASGVPAAEPDGSEPELRELEFSEVAVGFALLDEVGAIGADTVSPSRA